MSDVSLKAIREKQGLTQIRFSVKHRISLSIVQFIENHESNTPNNRERLAKTKLETRTRLAKAYGVSVETINAACDRESVPT